MPPASPAPSILRHTATTSPVASRPTVAEAYCRLRAVPAADFERALLREALHPFARRIRYVLALLPRYFEPDLRFIRYVGCLRRVDDLRYEEIDFKQDRANRGLLRGALRLRVSSRQLGKIVEEVLGERRSSRAPFQGRSPRIVQKH